MHGKSNEYTDALVPELSAYDQDTGSRMPPELDMDPWHPLLLQDSSGFLMPAFSSHVESCMNLELFYHNTTRTLDSIFCPPDAYNPAIYTDTDTEPAFILSSDIGWDFSISKNIGASIDADPCCGGSSQPTRIYTVGLSDTYPIPRASNPDYESVQFHECRALSGINDETNDVLANNDSQLVQCDSSSWPNSNQLSTSKFNMKENRKPNPILPFQSIEDSSRYPCFLVKDVTKHSNARNMSHGIIKRNTKKVGSASLVSSVARTLSTGQIT
ncbi:transcription factor [Fusarium langsethiae]|uniref:Transcription factor n=1 Tax=Fusarium langsethiae TaxID=179993 RepID=A0A0M9EMU8_FUSLA|nr:transcription factor [Fusarium langsethiae]